MGRAAPDPHPWFLRERLAECLRQYREEKGHSQGQAAGHIAWSVSKLQRIETGVVGISVTDTRALVDLYEIRDQDTVNRLLAMAREARRRDRFTPFRKFFTPEYQALLSYEGSAAVILTVNAFLIPGLLQTPRYARALLSAKHEGDKLDALVKARILRQEILGGLGTRFVFVIDEGALHRHVGGSEVLVEQLIHIREMTERPNIELHIIPFEAGAHLGLWELYTIMTIPGSSLTGWKAETIVYREAGNDEHLVRDDVVRIGHYETSFDHVMKLALDQEKTRGLIDRLKLQVEGTQTASSSLGR